MATAPSGKTRWSSTLRCATNCRCSASSASTAAGPPTRTTTSPAAISATPATTRWPRRWAATRSRSRSGGPLSPGARGQRLGRRSGSSPAHQRRSCPTGASQRPRGPERPVTRGLRPRIFWRGHQCLARLDRPLSDPQPELRLRLALERLTPGFCRSA
jgi:hypothetical protein